MPPVLNMPGLGIWQGCEYPRVTKSAECLNKPEYVLAMPRYA